MCPSNSPNTTSKWFNFILLWYLGQYYTPSQLIIWTLQRHGYNIQKVKIIPALYQWQYKAQYLSWKIKGRSFIFTITMHLSHVLKFLYSDSFVHFGEGNYLQGLLWYTISFWYKNRIFLTFICFYISCWMYFKFLFFLQTSHLSQTCFCFLEGGFLEHKTFSSKIETASDHL